MHQITEKHNSSTLDCELATTRTYLCTYA